MDLMFDISGFSDDEEEFSSSKKDVLKFLKLIGVDTRFISYTPQKIYINNLRFSKFSRKRQVTFNRQYPEIEVVRNKLFQKICAKSSKVLSDEIKPNSRILMPKDNHIIELLLEPYTRKYGVELVFEGEHDLKVNHIVLDDKVNGIFEGIFKGEGMEFSRDEDEIHPLANVSLEWINSFLKMDGKDEIISENTNEMAISFSEFLKDVAPQYKENVVKTAEFIVSKNG